MSGVVFLQSKEGPGLLVVRWEGFLNNSDSRDVGASINQCLGEKLMAEQAIYRASQWFSGWSCQTVGNPELILSLNYSPAKTGNFYCRKEGRNEVGQFSPYRTALPHLNVMTTWENPEMRRSACWYLSQGMVAMLAKKKVLVHCDAGSDQSGVYAAIVSAMVAEASQRLDKKMLQAIECDYRKSRSVSLVHYGRMEQFIKELQDRGGVSHFLQVSCEMDPIFIASVASRLMAKNSPLPTPPVPTAID